MARKGHVKKSRSSTQIRIFGCREEKKTEFTVVIGKDYPTSDESAEINYFFYRKIYRFSPRKLVIDTFGRSVIMTDAGTVQGFLRRGFVLFVTGVTRNYARARDNIAELTRRAQQNYTIIIRFYHVLSLP